MTKDGATGEIQIRATHQMKGYLNNALATAEAFTTDGWLRSGDIGYFKDGNWYVVDRTKDLIKVRGWQVSPAEIEAALLVHEDVVDAAVIGIPAFDGTGEVPMAFIVRKGDSSLDDSDIKDFLGSRLARYKRVEEVKFVDHIPRNPTGKILRRVLRDGRELRPISPSQVIASAYSNAIRDLSDYQKRRQSQEGSANGHSRDGSLTDADTIETTSIKAVTPPCNDKLTSAAENSKKRKNEQDESPVAKRRSVRTTDSAVLPRPRIRKRKAE